MKYSRLIVALALSGICAAADKEIDQGRVNRVLADVQRLMKIDSKRPVLGSYVTRKSYQVHVEAQLAQLLPERRLGGTLALLQDLQLLPGGKLDIKQLLKQFQAPAIAYYDATTKKMHFIGSQTSDGTLFHELAHAMQDQEHDINATAKKIVRNGTLDNLIGFKFLVEGEATFWTKLYRSKKPPKLTELNALHERLHFGSPRPLTSARIISNLQRNAKKNPKLLFAALAMRIAPPLMVRFAYLPYTSGDNAAFHIVRDQGRAGLRKLFMNPRELNSRDMMFAKSLVKKRRGIRQVKVIELPADFGKEWRLLTSDTMGAFIWHTLLESREEQATKISQEWLGDSVRLWRNKEKQILVAKVVFHDDKATQMLSDELVKLARDKWFRGKNVQDRDGVLTSGKSAFACGGVGKIAWFVKTKGVAIDQVTALLTILKPNQR